MGYYEERDAIRAGWIQIGCGCLSIPWVVIFAIFWVGNPDEPKFCYVTPGELWVSLEATGAEGELDYAA